jgi:protein-tyrosine sulfotransferase
MSNNAKILFVLAPAPRSGTNYLQDLLVLHPAIKAAAIDEDYLLPEFHKLRRFCTDSLKRAVIKNPEQRVGEQVTMQRVLGGALADYVGRTASPDTAFVISKSPALQGVEAFENFGDEARVLVVVRNGRDVVESTVKSFPWISPSYALHRWVDGCRMLAGLPRRLAERLMIVRYEDMFRAPGEAMKAVLPWLGVAPGDYPFDKVGALPIRGSSEMRRQKKDVTWDPVPKWQNFAPDKRSASWSPLQVARFQMYAGPWNVALGYPPDPAETNIVIKAASVLQHAADSLLLRLRRSRRALVQRDIGSFPPFLPVGASALREEIAALQRLMSERCLQLNASGE